MQGQSAVDDHEWADRSRHWSNSGKASKDKRRRRQPSRHPLVLAGHGVSLRIEAGTLLVRNGFTHYPQKQQAYRFFKGDADLPPRIIMLDGSGSITFDVLTWLNEQKVSLVLFISQKIHQLASNCRGRRQSQKHPLFCVPLTGLRVPSLPMTPSFAG